MKNLFRTTALLGLALSLGACTTLSKADRELLSATAAKAEAAEATAAQALQAAQSAQADATAAKAGADTAIKTANEAAALAKTCHERCERMFNKAQRK